jgi:predicted 3-demethylubiquinone-9 3-methyltransferase (glyoxalase superfamily)
MKIQKITPCLWFDSQAEQAAKFYTSIFKNSKILDVVRYSTETPSHKPKGSILTVTFQINGQKFVALNGGPYFKLNEAVSFMIPCKTQKEIDYYWKKLSAVKKAEMCGWLKDKFGVSWQIVPEYLDKMLKDKKRSEKVMQALLQMHKLDIKKLQQAYKQK